MSQTYEGPRQLRRSRTDRYVGGVCGGLARYLNMDPTLVRILTVVVTLFTAVPVVLYVVAWLLVPEEDVAPVVPPVAQTADPLWGAGGPPWAPTPGTEASTRFTGTMGSGPGAPTADAGTRPTGPTDPA